MVRQFLQGQRFFKQEFGKICSQVLYMLTDALFPSLHCALLPGVLKSQCTPVVTLQFLVCPRSTLSHVLNYNVTAKL